MLLVWVQLFSVLNQTCPCLFILADGVAASGDRTWMKGSWKKTMTASQKYGIELLIGIMTNYDVMFHITILLLTSYPITGQLLFFSENLVWFSLPACMCIGYALIPQSPCVLGQHCRRALGKRKRLHDGYCSTWEGWSGASKVSCGWGGDVEIHELAWKRNRNSELTFCTWFWQCTHF